MPTETTGSNLTYWNWAPGSSSTATISSGTFATTANTTSTLTWNTTTTANTTWYNQPYTTYTIHYENRDFHLRGPITIPAVWVGQTRRRGDDTMEI